MNLNRLIIFLPLLSSCSYFQPTGGNQQSIICFEQYIGEQNAFAFNSLESSFTSFLTKNYPTSSKKECDFLLDIQRVLEGETFESMNWVFDKKEIKSVLEKLETSGFRKEIWLFGNEEYYPYHLSSQLNNVDDGDSIFIDIEDEIIPITNRNMDLDTDIDSLENYYNERSDSFRSFNRTGAYVHGLKECCKNDTMVMDYVEATVAAGDISPFIMVEYYLKNIDNYEDYFIRRMIALEFYYGIIEKELKEN